MQQTTHKANRRAVFIFGRVRFWMHKGYPRYPEDWVLAFTR